MSLEIGDLKISAEKEREDQLRKLVRFASSFYVMPLFLLFGVADWLWYPKFFYLFLGLRFLTVIMVSLLNLVISKQTNLSRVQIWGSCFIAACVWPLHIMVFATGDPSTPYYGGLVLIVAGLAGGFRFTWGYFAFNIGQAIVPMLIWGLFAGGVASLTFFPLNLLFLISVAVIMTVSRVFNERLHMREFHLRNQLNSEIESRNSLIEKKTNESLKLHSLSKQFSPQIIKSLQSGVLSLDGRVHRTEICVIFVDIVGSTDKFIRLDRDDLQKILSMFMEDVMGTFLKYDITIDKFLGDGVLGFSNDPVAQKDYIERVLRASVEIVTRIKNRQEEYNSYWLAEFEVSAGIAAGFASVGFYGSELHVKNYTAIGRAVNLASRLGSLAGANEVLVSQDIISKLKQAGSTSLQDFKFADKGTPSLKGFESEKIRVYSIDTGVAMQQSEQTSKDAEACPHGHGLLHLEQDNSGIYFFKCRFCDYQLDENGKAVNGMSGTKSAA